MSVQDALCLMGPSIPSATNYVSTHHCPWAALFPFFFQSTTSDKHRLTHDTNKKIQR